MSFHSAPRGSQPRPALPGALRPLGAGIGLAAFIMAAGAASAEAGGLTPLGAAACGPAAFAAPSRATACRLASLERGSPARGPADAAPGDGVRLVLAANRGAAAMLLGAGPDARHDNPFTLVGNRTGLETAARVETRDGETWLVPASEDNRAIGLAALQGGGSSVASR